jgi:hypothetical protein
VGILSGSGTHPVLVICGTNRVRVIRRAGPHRDETFGRIGVTCAGRTESKSFLPIHSRSAFFATERTSSEYPCGTDPWFVPIHLVSVLRNRTDLVAVPVRYRPSLDWFVPIHLVSVLRNGADLFAISVRYRPILRLVRANPLGSVLRNGADLVAIAVRYRPSLQWFVPIHLVSVLRNGADLVATAVRCNSRQIYACETLVSAKLLLSCESRRESGAGEVNAQAPSVAPLSPLTPREPTLPLSTLIGQICQIQHSDFPYPKPAQPHTYPRLSGDR